MSVLQVEIPESILLQAKKLAEQTHVPIDQIVAKALHELVSAQEQLAWFNARAERGRNVNIKEILRKSSDVEPDENDRIE
jgi:predicted transcriptional regulator